MTENDGAHLDLVHFSVGPVRFAVMSEQVAWIGEEGELDPSEATAITELIDFGPLGETVGLSAVLGVKGPTGEESTLLVGNMDSIERAVITQLKALPPLIEKHAVPKGIWAATERSGGYTLLVDLHKLMDESGFIKKAANNRRNR